MDCNSVALRSDFIQIVENVEFFGKKRICAGNFFNLHALSFAQADIVSPFAFHPFKDFFCIWSKVYERRVRRLNVNAVFP